MRRPASHARGVAAAVVLLALGPAAARAQSVLTFEDLCYSSVPRCGYEAPSVLFPGGPITTAYAGFTWWNFRPLDLDNFALHRPDPDPLATGTAGYPYDPARYGTVLGLAFGDVYIHRPVGSGFGLFRIDDLSIGSGWTSGTRLDVVGWRQGVTVLSVPDVRLSATSTTHLDLPDVWVDALAFTADFTPPGYTDPYGSAQQNGGTPYRSFWFDNVRYDVTPEPTTLALLGGGLAVLGLTLVRRRRT
jgi:hypothetical protein